MSFDFMKHLKRRSTFCLFLRCVLGETYSIMWENEEDWKKTRQNTCSNSWLMDFRVFIQRMLFIETSNLTIFYWIIMETWKLEILECQNFVDKEKQWWNNVELLLTSLLKFYLIKDIEDLELMFGVQESSCTQCCMEQYLSKDLIWVSYISSLSKENTLWKMTSLLKQETY